MKLNFGLLFFSWHGHQLFKVTTFSISKSQCFTMNLWYNTKWTIFQNKYLLLMMESLLSWVLQPRPAIVCALACKLSRTWSDKVNRAKCSSSMSLDGGAVPCWSLQEALKPLPRPIYIQEQSDFIKPLFHTGQCVKMHALLRPETVLIKSNELFNLLAFTYRFDLQFYLKDKLSEQTKYVSHTFLNKQIKILIGWEQHCYLAKEYCTKEIIPYNCSFSSQAQWMQSCTLQWDFTFNLQI